MRAYSQLDRCWPRSGAGQPSRMRSIMLVAGARSRRYRPDFMWSPPEQQQFPWDPRDHPSRHPSVTLRIFAGERESSFTKTI